MKAALSVMLAASLSVAVLVPRSVEAAGELASAKALYAAASYEEALKQLSAAVDDDVDQVDQYRALCLLALGRTREAEAPLEQMVSRRPLYVMTESDASPKLVELFQEVRKRALPTVAKELYQKGRTSFDSKNYEGAASHFRQLMAIANTQDAASLGTAVADLKQLGDGFLKLAEAALAPPPPPAVAPAPPPPASIPVERQAPKVYSLMDADVLGPVDISRQLPPWVPPNRAQARTPFRGTLTIIINERGTVETATIGRSVTAEYDQELIAATRFWKFRPAVRNGLPVKYEKTIDIVLQPRP